MFLRADSPVDTTAANAQQFEDSLPADWTCSPVDLDLGPGLGPRAVNVQDCDLGVGTSVFFFLWEDEDAVRAHAGQGGGSCIYFRDRVSAVWMDASHADVVGDTFASWDSVGGPWTVLGAEPRPCP